MDVKIDESKRPRLYSERFLHRPKGLRVKADILEFMAKQDIWVSKTFLKKKLGLHAYLVDLMLKDMLDNDMINEIEYTGGFLYMLKKKGQMEGDKLDEHNSGST